jgi:hypothetical protein
MLSPLVWLCSCVSLREVIAHVLAVLSTSYYPVARQFCISVPSPDDSILYLIMCPTLSCQIPSTIFTYVEWYVLRSRSRCNHEQAKSDGASPVVEAAPGNPLGLCAGKT